MKAFYTPLLVFLTLSGFAQKTLPYQTNFDTDTEKDGWVQYRLKSTEFYNWTLQGNPNGVLSHDYPVGAQDADTTYDWMVSPALDLTKGGEVSLQVTGFALLGVTDNDYFGIWVSTGSPDPKDGDYEEVVDLTTFSLQNQAKDTSGIDLKSLAGDGHIAFVYQATHNWFTVSIDSVVVSVSSTSIEKPNADLIGQIYYSDHDTYLSHTSQSSVTCRIYATNGQLIYSGFIGSGLTTLTQLVDRRGLYLVRLENGEVFQDLRFIK